MKLASLFDGIGGFPLSALSVGIEPIWASEIEKNCVTVTKKHFPDMKHYGSVCDIRGAEVEPVYIVTFGSPCQDLSVAGKRAGMGEGTRSGLFSEAVRIIREMRDGTNRRYPRFAVWENVPGAFSSNKGEDFRAVIESLAKVAEETVSIPMPKDGRWEPSGLVEGNGWSIAWRTLDAQFWGVPQRRKRIFLVADFGGQCASEIFFERESVSGNITESGNKGEKIARGVEGGVDKTVCFVIRGGCEGGGKGYLGSEERALTLDTVMSQRIHCVHATQDPITAKERTHALGANSSQAVFYNVTFCDSNGTRQDRPNGGLYVNETEKSNTLATSGPEGTLSVFRFQRSDSYSDEPQEISSTLGAVEYKQGKDLVVSQTVRRLTPTECSRLQGYPDGWCDIEGSSDSAKYKALGNSVAIPCVKFILGCIARSYAKMD